VSRDVRQHNWPLMSIYTYKRLTVALSVICVALLAMCGWLFWRYGWLKIQVAFASEQTQIFEDMRTKAFQGDAGGAAGCLGYVIWYYPSGSKQDKGSLLDRMVERDRARTVRDIVAYLRAKADKDLGEDPEVWLRNYVQR
jgi:hypothetical protein